MFVEDIIGIFYKCKTKELSRFWNIPERFFKVYDKYFVNIPTGSLSNNLFKNLPGMSWNIRTNKTMFLECWNNVSGKLK